MNRVTKISSVAGDLAVHRRGPGHFPRRRRVAQTLNISIESETGGSPPGELVVTDPSGDRTGPDAPDIQLPNPMSGLYNLRVIGLKIGVYTLILKAYSDSGSTSDVRFPHMTIQDGEVHHYRINFSARGPKLDVRRTRVTEE